MKKLIYLTKKEIIDSNKAVIDVYGGNYLPPYNLLNESALDNLVEIVEHGILFGETMYPKLEDKAALHLFNITENHIFSDGNKRTGLDTMLIFLQLNGFELKIPLEVINNVPELTQPADDDTILEKLVFEVAQSRRKLQDLSEWISHNMKKSE
jgi:death-on-curing protein